MFSVNSIMQDLEGDLNTCKISLRLFSMLKTLPDLNPVARDLPGLLTVIRVIIL